ncbi:ATP-dependent DNA helicase pfh1 [Fulvia fulva]|uniref:ATP-dependent DNA helicase n=1 Tax=Passalora fulva TaxID=5499 RepID=A0A9Q8P7Q2_PASFU|nr:ATP-dependent DNA helicase pfh1 [Fulvia fulva]UJO16276.1 ATP-dependent DNA helicase pfh1 [Fulvia fulva]
MHKTSFVRRGYNTPATNTLPSRGNHSPSYNNNAFELVTASTATGGIHPAVHPAPITTPESTRKPVAAPDKPAGQCGKKGHLGETCWRTHPELRQARKEEVAEKQSIRNATAHISVKASWRLRPSEVPLSCKKIYCVLKRVKPGFYYEYYGPDGAEAQVRGVQDSLHKSLPQGTGKKITRDRVGEYVTAAVKYMNHDSTACDYGCGGQCAVARPEVPADSTTRSADATPAAVAGIKVTNRSRNCTRNHLICRDCGHRPPMEKGRVCQECFDSDETSTRLTSAVTQYSLSEEQYEVLKLAAQGRNVFFTGAAGTGKSRVLEAIVRYLNKSGLSPQVVAPTGMAALQVYGSTIHTFAGWTVKLAKGSPEELSKAAKMPKNYRRFYRIDVLIIDEISMVENDMLSRLSYVLQEALQRAQPDRPPFGDMQVIITGDFYQLPPVLPFETCLKCGEQLEGWKSQKEDVYRCKHHGEFRDEDKYAFASPVWQACNFANVELLQVHRQSDVYFTRLLHKMRKGIDWTSDQEKELLNHENDVVFDEAVKLCPLRREAEAINDAHMEALNTPSHTYSSVDDLTWVRQHPEFLDARRPDGMTTAPLHALFRHRYQDSLELKEGMLVILTRNISTKEKLVNGSTGKIIGFTDMNDETMPRAKKNNKDETRNGEELITGVHRRYAEDKIRYFKDQAEDKLWPIVRFKDGREIPIYADCCVTELGRDEPYSLLSRTQIPLIAGWALSIHKSQGMTLDNVVTSLDKCFAPGQAYVAMSRARSLRNMLIQSLPPKSMLLPDQTVHDFMERTFGGIKLEELVGGEEDDRMQDVKAESDAEEFHDAMDYVEVIPPDMLSDREGDDDSDDFGELDEEYVELLDL